MKRRSLFVMSSLLFICAALPGLLSAHPQEAPRRIEVTASKFAFAPGEITLKKGQPVVIVLTTADVAHGLRFRDLDLNLKADKKTPGELAFTPQKTGTFTGHCSVFCGSGHGDMVLTLHVVD